MSAQQPGMTGQVKEDILTRNAVSDALFKRTAEISRIEVKFKPDKILS